MNHFKSNSLGTKLNATANARKITNADAINVRNSVKTETDRQTNRHTYRQKIIVTPNR